MKASLSFPIAPRMAQFARTNMRSFCPKYRTTISLWRCNNRRMRMHREINCRKRMESPDGRHSIGNETKSNVVTISLQPSFPMSGIIRLKNERKTMQIKDDVSESDALTISKSASALGVHEFSLFSRIQAGDINAARLWSGEMAIPISELERLSKLSIYSLAVPPDKPETVLSDARLGIKRETYGGLMGDGEHQRIQCAGR